jgi:hypothetical protein
LTTSQQLELHKLKAALSSVGLTLVGPKALPAKPRLPTPTLAGDARKDMATIPTMRRLRDW